MSLGRALVTVVIVAVAVLGPALFMASSPCLDCDGVCGAGATGPVVSVRAALLALPVIAEAPAQIPSPLVLLSELPPRPFGITA